LLLFPAGTYIISATLTIPEGVYLQGEALGQASASASATEHVTQIVWEGSNITSEYMVEVMSASANEYVHNWGIDKIFLNGNNKAFGGLHTASCRMMNIGRLFVEKCRFAGWVIDDSNGEVGGAFSECDYYSYNSRSDAAAANSSGLKMTQVSATGVTSMHFNHVVTVTVDGNGVDIGNCDNHVFEKVVANVSGTGDGVLFRGLTDSQTAESRKNVIWQFSGQNIRAQAGSRTWVGVINSEGTSVDCDANASLQYSVIDRNDGRRYTTPQYLTHERRYLTLNSGYVASGSPALTVYGAGTMQGIAFDPAASTETWQWVLPPFREWSEGRILGATIWGIKSSTANAGDIVMQLGALIKSTASGVGGGFTTTNKVHTVDGAGTQTLSEITFTFATPVDLPSDCHLLVQLTRLGNNAGDTYADDYVVLSMAINFQANVAREGVTDYRYDPPADIVV
jgi:hypothetical protein